MTSSRVVLTGLKSAQSKFNIFTSIRPESQLEGITSSVLTAAIKDNIVTKEEPTTCSSKVLQDYVSPFEATVIEQLGDDVKIVGKTNMDEFGMGSGTTHSIFGPTLNPLYPEEQRVSGGSSGGSAAAVASGVVDFALGTDTGGSVRLPAAYTGVYGFKPTYGRISRWGVIAYAQSLDTVGILSKNLSIVEKIYSRLDKHDPKDPTSILPETRSKINDLVETTKRSTLRVGIPTEFILDNLSLEVLNGWKDVLLKLSKVAEIVPVSIPTLKYALPIYYTIAPAEASSNLARYDGIRYGFRSDSDKNNYAKTRSLGFNKVVQNRILLGNYNLNADSYKNHFLKATLLRSQLVEEINQIFKTPRVQSKNLQQNDEGVDVLVSPTSITTAPTLEEFGKQTSTETYTNDTLTVPASLAGLPAISVPWKTIDSTIGVQIMAQYGDDKKTLDVAKVISELN